MKRENDVKCPNGVCNHAHAADEYAVGFFIVDGKVVKVKGEAAVMHATHQTTGHAADCHACALAVVEAGGPAENPDFLGSTIYWDEALAKAVVREDGDVVEAFQNHARAGVLEGLDDEEFAIYTHGAMHPGQSMQLKAAMKRIAGVARR